MQCSRGSGIFKKITYLTKLPFYKGIITIEIVYICYFFHLNSIYFKLTFLIIYILFYDIFKS